MSTTPVAQPYWKQAMPAAYNADAFNNLTPEEQAREKKKAGCCASFCCCLCTILIVIIVLVAAGTFVASQCADENTCPYEDLGKGELTLSDPRTFTSDLNSVSVTVMRGQITVSNADDLSATVINTAMKADEIYEKNDFIEEDGVWVSEYETSGTGTNDCYYCRKSRVALDLPTNLEDVYLNCRFCSLDLDATIGGTGDVEVVSTSGDISVTSDITGNNIRVATDFGDVDLSGSSISATSKFEFASGRGTVLTGNAESSITNSIVAEEADLTANEYGILDLNGDVSSTEFHGEAKISGQFNVNSTNTITASADITLTGQGTFNVDGSLVTPTLHIDASASGVYNLNALSGESLTNITVHSGLGSDITMKYACAADTELSFEVTYLQKDSSLIVPRYLIGSVEQSLETTSEPVEVLGVAYNEITGSFTGCTTGGATKKYVTIDMVENISNGVVEFIQD